jgi:two-component system, LytTR family, response regulator
MRGRPLTVLAADDERAPLDDLARILRASPRVSEVQTASTAHDAVLNASRRHYDVVFLDVQMPELDGLEIARVLNAFVSPPAVVFVTAFESYAVSAFELHALDYLMKPVTPRRVEEALERVPSVAAEASEPERDPGERSEVAPEDYVLAVSNVSSGGTRLVPTRSILYLKAYGDYIRVFADSGRYLIRGRLADAEHRLRAHGFLRVHRQYLANIRRVVEVQPVPNGTALLRLDDQSMVPVARRHLPELRRQLLA